jgi:argonaute-like protein implicated in RNA metabolism and viral defense
VPVLGLASQMVDEMTVLNPEWRDLNLGLNIFAKAGYVPWVLENAIPNVDLFIGLSYSQIKRGSRTVRMMAYVNVFDAYGRWHFCQSDSQAFPFDARLEHFTDLVKNALAAYRGRHGGPLKSIQIHLTKKFSAAERAILVRAVRSIAPDARVVFVSVNTNHPIRLYDLSEQSDGSVARATYLPCGSTRIYLATTGKNTFNEKMMGTPIPLELTVWADPHNALPPLSEICQQILSLTRLNWASSRSFCQEPITTKFAGDISNLMKDFLEDPTFSVNPRLRDTPWFL